VNLYNVLSPNRIKIDLENLDKPGVIAELCDLTISSGRIHDRETMLSLFHARERLKSTGIGHGVAIPHAQSDEVEGIIVSMGISNRDIDFEALDNRPVHIVFLIAAETHQSIPYLSLLSHISRLMRNRDIRKRIQEARNPEEVMEIIKTEELKIC
jgi:mannitol/fructose-specific phosphotransferase system IIA component (Ntr-type)